MGCPPGLAVGEKKTTTINPVKTHIDFEMYVCQHAACVFFLQWPGGAAVRAAPAASAPAAGCRLGLSAGVKTTAPHLDDQKRVGEEKNPHV